MELTDERYLDEMLSALYVSTRKGKITLESFKKMIAKDLSSANNQELNVELIIDKLCIDEHIVVNEYEGSVDMTASGIKFTLSNEGYTHLSQKRDDESRIREETIKSLYRGKWAIIISILALLVSIGTLIHSIWKRN